jgi:hypothetical protein
MVRNPCSHRRSYAQRLVHAPKVVMHEVKHDSIAQIVYRFEKAFVRRAKRRKLTHYLPTIPFGPYGYNLL